MSRRASPGAEVLPILPRGSSDAAASSPPGPRRTRTSSPGVARAAGCGDRGPWAGPRRRRRSGSEGGRRPAALCAAPWRRTRSRQRQSGRGRRGRGGRSPILPKRLDHGRPLRAMWRRPAPPTSARRGARRRPPLVRWSAPRTGGRFCLIHLLFPFLLDLQRGSETSLLEHGLPAAAKALLGRPVPPPGAAAGATFLGRPAAAQRVAADLRGRGASPRMRRPEPPTPALLPAAPEVPLCSPFRPCPGGARPRLWA